MWYASIAANSFYFREWLEPRPYAKACLSLIWLDWNCGEPTSFQIAFSCSTHKQATPDRLNESPSFAYCRQSNPGSTADPNMNSRRSNKTKPKPCRSCNAHSSSSRRVHSDQLKSTISSALAFIRPWQATIRCATCVVANCASVSKE